MARTLVIVGAGQAGFSVAAKLRSLGDDRPIVLLGREPDLPYQRPPLSKKYLQGEMEFERLLLRPRAWFDEQGVEVRPGATVVRIDRDRQTVLLADGADLAYDHLVLTTGATPRRLPPDQGGDLAGVHGLRDRADVDALQPALASARRLLIIGGGYIGLEAAAVARARGLEVVLIEAAARILARVAAAETADLIRDLHRHHGVDLREGTGLAHLSGDDGRVTAAHLTDGTRLDVDLVIVGIGVSANDRLADEARLTVNQGILVDPQGRTSDPRIFAAGDCALQPWEDGLIRLESVQNAVDQGEAVALALTGSTAPYRPRPWFWSDQYDAKLQIAGLNRGYDEVLLRPGSRPGSGSVWYFRDGRFLAVDALNEAKAYAAGKRLLELGRSVDRQILGDPTADLRQLLAG